MKEKIFGTIKWFKKEKGYGYIIGDDTETYFFEIVNCLNPEEKWQENNKVLFVPNYGQITYATKVEKSDKNA